MCTYIYIYMYAYIHIHIDPGQSAVGSRKFVLRNFSQTLGFEFLHAYTRSPLEDSPLEDSERAPGKSYATTYEQMDF